MWRHHSWLFDRNLDDSVRIMREITHLGDDRMGGV